MDDFWGLEKIKYKIFDSSHQKLTHIYKPILPSDEAEILANFKAQHLSLLRQEHSNIVHYADKSYSLQTGDAIVTDQKEVVLGVQTADCVCALLASTDQKVIAAAHLGWKGAASDLLSKTIAMMRQFSSAEIRAIISPCIRQSSYEVDKIFFNNFTDKKPQSSPFFRLCNEKLYFNLPGFVKFELELNDVTEIYDQNHCTYSSQNFFSYRLAKHQGLEERRRLLSCLAIGK